MRIRTILATGALAAVATVSLGTAANAVTLPGFLGKGEVQTALGYNNAALQKAVDNKTLNFTTEQDATLLWDQVAHRDVTQHITETVVRTVSCTEDTGSEKNPKVFVRYGTRDGERVGTQTGTQSGTRSGHLDGKVTASVVADVRKTGQWTGFNLTAPDTTGAVPTWTGGSATDVNYGGVTWGEVSTSDTTWEGWQSESNENPASCLSGNDSVSDLSDTTEVVSTTDGAIEFGEVSYEDMVVHYPWTLSAPVLFVNGHKIG